MKAFFAGVILILAGQGSALAAPMAMPEEVQDVRLGMTISELLSIRPIIKKQLSEDPEWSPNRSSDIIVDELPSGAHFAHAIYIFEKQRLSAVSLYSKKAGTQEAVAQRKAVFGKLLNQWGRPSRKEIGALSSTKGGSSVVWSTASMDAYLFSADSPAPRHSPTILMLIHSSARTRLKPGFKKRDVADSEKSRLLRADGLEE